MKRIALALCLVAGGCVPYERSSTLEQRQRENVSQKALADFTVSAKPEPLSVILPDGTRIQQPVASAIKAHVEQKESSNSEASGATEWSESIPLFAKLIGLGLGLALIAGVVFWIIKTVRQNPAVDAAWTGASDIISRKIEALKAAHAATDDPAKKATLQSAINQLHEAHAETLA